MDANRFLAVCLALLVWTLSTTASAETVTDTVMDSNNKEKVTIQLKWFHQFQFAGYYAAVEKGFYAEEGLEVELLQHVPDSNHINNVLQGGAQYGVSNAGLLLERMRGKPVVLLAQIFQHSPLVFLSREDSGIRKPEDLAGKRVTFNVGGYRHMPLIALLQSTTGGLDAVRIEPFSFNYHELIDGKSDAVPAYITDQPYWFRQRDVAVNIINPRDYGISFYGDNLFTTEQELSEHPQRAEKIRRASLKGWRYALNNSDEIIDLILEKYNPQGLSRDHLAYEARETKNLILPDFVEIGSFNPTRYQKTADVYARSGFVEQMTLDPGFFYQPKTLAKSIVLTAEEKAWLAEHPTYTVSSYPLAPYIMQEDGKVTGYMTELLRIISAKVNLTPRFIYNEVSSEALQGIQTGEVEASMGRIETPQLSKHVTFSPDTLLLNLAIFAQKGTKSMNSIEALKGKRIASYGGYSMHTLFVKYFPDTQLVLADDAVGMLQLVATGKADAAMQELYSGQYILSKYLINNLEVKGFAKFKGGEPLHGHSYLVHKSFPLLQSILDKGYKALALSERQALWDKWFGGESKVTDAPKIQLTSEERAWLAENPVLKIGYDIDWPPIEKWTKDDGLVGLSADYFSLIKQRLGITIEPAVPTDWASMLELARKAEVDLMTAVVQTPQRDHFLDFTQPYLSFPMVIVTREEVTYIRKMNELNGKKVGVVSGYASQDRLANNHPKIKIMPAQDVRKGLLDVVKGNTFAFVGNLATISRIIAREGLSEIKISGETPYKYDLRIGIRKGEALLGLIMQKALDSISEEERAKIYSNWVNVTYEHKFNYKLLWQILAIGMFVLAIFIYWNHRLRKEVKYRHRAEDALKNSNVELEIRVKQRTHSLDERVKELNCLYGIEKLAGQKNASVEEMIQATVDLIPASYQYQEITCVCIVFKDREFKSKDFEATEWQQSAYIKVDENKVGEVRVFYKEEKHDVDEGPFLKEERSMINNIASRLGVLAERKKAEKTLRESEQQLRLITDNVPVFISYVDSDLRYRFNNKPYEDLFGKSAKELYGKHIKELLGESAYQQNRSKYEEVLSGKSINFEMSLSTVDGRKLCFNGCYIPDIAEDGKVKGFFFLGSDITERKQAEEALRKSEKLYHSLVETMNEGLGMIDENGMFTYVNEQFCKILGYYMTEIIGGHWMSFYDEGAQKAIEDQLKKRAKGSTESYELENTRKDGKKIWMGISPKPIYDEAGNVKGSMGLVQDITERKHAEAALSKAYDEMESRVKARTSELQQAKEAAETANQAKNTFLSNMSHELRTPLNAILGFSQLLLRDQVTHSEQQNQIKIIKRSGENLLEHISDILDLASIESNKIELTSTSSNITTFIHYICNYFKASTEEKGIELICEASSDTPSIVGIDEKRLQQILLNLVGNAVKFTDHGKVVLRVEPCELASSESNNQRCLRFKVQDTGVGISPESYEQVFEPFVQLKRPNQITEGTGLGLSIAQQLVGLMGGELKVESEVGVGSCFWFDLMLPVSEKQEITRAKPEHMPAGYQGKERTVLVVDDIADNRAVLRDLLQSMRFKVLLAQSGDEAITLMRGAQPDLILMDLLMPAMDGYMALSILREIFGTTEIPVVAISASVSEEESALSAGFDGFIPKPTPSDALVDVLGDLLKLEWIESVDETTDEDDLVYPPDEELEPLSEWIQLGKMRQIIKWAKELMSAEPEYTNFAQRVIMFAKDVDEEGLRVLIGKN